MEPSELHRKHTLENIPGRDWHFGILGEHPVITIHQSIDNGKN